MKNKKNNATKKNAKPTAGSRPFEKIGKRFARLSTPKKAVGVLALAAIGLSYLAKRRSTNKGTSPSLPNAEGPE